MLILGEWRDGRVEGGKQDTEKKGDEGGGGKK